MIIEEYKEECITCPFNAEHKAPKRRMLYHLSKCATKKWCELHNVEYFTCRFNQYHIFFSKDDLQTHYKVCEYGVCGNKYNRLQRQVGSHKKQS